MVHKAELPCERIIRSRETLAAEWHGPQHHAVGGGRLLPPEAATLPPLPGRPTPPAYSHVPLTATTYPPKPYDWRDSLRARRGRQPRRATLQHHAARGAPTSAALRPPRPSLWLPNSSRDVIARCGVEAPAAWCRRWPRLAPAHCSPRQQTRQNVDVSYNLAPPQRRQISAAGGTYETLRQSSVTGAGIRVTCKATAQHRRDRARAPGQRRQPNHGEQRVGEVAATRQRAPEPGIAARVAARRLAFVGRAKHLNVELEPVPARCHQDVSAAWPYGIRRMAVSYPRACDLGQVLI